MGFYDLSAEGMSGETVSMKQYEGKVVLVVNTASKCGLTPQFKELEALYRQYKEKGLVILGFPCNQFANQEPGNASEISEFCQINYGVTFKMFQKIEVNGKGTHPLYCFLKSQAGSIFNKEIKWNFTKFLVDSQGKVVRRYAPTTSPLKIANEIEKLMSLS